MARKDFTLIRIHRIDLIELKRIRECISEEWEREASLADVIRRLLRTNKKFKVANPNPNLKSKKIEWVTSAEMLNDQRD